MDLILEVKGDAPVGFRKQLTSGRVYVLGSQDSSTHGQAIRLDNAFVKKDHVQLEHTRAGWKITAMQPQVRRRDRGNVPLPVHEAVRFGPNSKFAIGPLEFQFLAPLRQDAEDDASVEQGSTLNSCIDEIHLSVTAETQMLNRIEKPDTHDKAYQAEVERIIVARVDATLTAIPAQELTTLAAEGGRRDLIYRVLGGDGVMVPDAGLGISDIDCADFSKIQTQMIRELALVQDGDSHVPDLEKVNRLYAEVFARASRGFNSMALRKLMKKTLVQSVSDTIFGIGPLEYLRKNPAISEIMVVAADRIFVEVGGSLVETGLAFVDEKSSQSITSYIVGRVNKNISVQTPYQDARLADGSRVNAVIRPIALNGTALTIRKFGQTALTREQLIGFDCMSPAMASFIMGCVVSKKNIIVSGGTGTGKTTMVNWMGTMIPPDERVVTVEDTAELQLLSRNIVRLEARPASSSGEGEVSIRHLVQNALRMRPDRIVVGECRGGEAFDMLQAMNTGHEGSMTTLHANNPVETMSRMENLVLMANQGLPIDAVRYQIAGSVDFVVQLTRYPNGRRKISEIAEIGGIDPITQRVEVNPVFRTYYDPSRRGSVGEFSFSGRTPDQIVDIIKGGFDPRTLSF